MAAATENQPAWFRGRPTAVEDLPQLVLDNAAHSVYALLRDEAGVNITKAEALALLVVLSPWSSDAGRYLERLT